MPRKGHTSSVPAFPAERHEGRCDACGKLRYASRKLARAAAKARHQDSRMRAYRCGDWWHVGHRPRWVVRGEEEPQPRLLGPPRR